MYHADFSYMPDDELYSLKDRATGLSTRIIDKLVQDFFNEPMGTKIYVHDHFSSRLSDLFLGDRMARRLNDEFHVKFKYNKNTALGPYFVREEPTYHELVMEEIDRREGKSDKPKGILKILRYKRKHK